MDKVIIFSHQLTYSLKWYLMGLLCFWGTNSLAQKTDSLLLEIKQTTSDTLKGKLYNELSSSLWFTAPQDALSYAEKALNIGHESQNHRLQIHAFRNLGATYWVKGEYPQALKNYQKMLAISQAQGNQQAMAKAYNNLAMVYKAQHNDSMAIEYYKKSLDLHKAHNNKRGFAIVSGNLGAVYLNINQLEKSLEYHFQALKIGQEIGRKRTVGNAYHNIGEVYLLKGWYERAKDYFEKSLSIYQAMDESWSIGHAKNGLAKCYLNMKMYQKALPLSKEAFDIAQNIGAKELVKEACEVLTQIHEHEQNFQAALKFQKLYFIYADSLINENKNNEIHQLELQQRDSENALLRKEKELHQLSNERKSIIILSIAGALLSSVILAIILYRSRQKAQKLNSVLQVKNRKIQFINNQLEKQKTEIESQNLKLKKQGQAIIEQRDLIKGRNEKITRSITAAQTIQQAMLPYPNQLKETLNNHFIVYRPKDIVSGDFYWCNKIDNHIIVAALDCTGHGVPGALMSMIGHTLLEHIVVLKREINPAKILDFMNQKVVELLRQKQNNDYHGMDAGIASICKHDDKVSIVFSGAKRSMFYVLPNTNTLETLPATNKSIGGRQYQEKVFENHTVVLPSGSMLYLSSDGYEDQHNKLRRKIGRERFKKLLSHCASLAIHDQKELLENKLDEYADGVEQRDDILVIGIRL